MKKPFREFHLFQLLAFFGSQNLPLDIALRKYFLNHKAIGAKDRKFIAETIYGMIRWQGLIDHFCTPPIVWEKRFEIFSKEIHLKAVNRKEIPLHVRASFPKNFFTLLETHFGKEQALNLCLISNEPAPTTIRINPLKTTREALLETWKKDFLITPTIHSNLGLNFDKRTNFFALPEFKEGFFEVQDEASQLISDLVEAKPGNHVLDFCAGSGGKTLGFAHKMNQKGQIYLHDIRSFVLDEAKKRLKRAGIQNAQMFPSDLEQRKKLKKKMDWIIVDVPCSGSGTFRRSPDLKWKFNINDLQTLVEEQRKIFKEALEYLHPKGKIVYSTCSILPEENGQQIDFFQKNYGLSLVHHPFQSLPSRGGMDGFFGAVLILN